MDMLSALSRQHAKTGAQTSRSQFNLRNLRIGSFAVAC
jgi:hypothetical protein